GRRVAVEEEGTLAARPDGDEGDAGARGPVRADAGGVDALGLERADEERAEVVGADEGHEAGVGAEARQPAGGVGRRAAEVAREALRVAQEDAALLGEEVDDHLAEREDVKHGPASSGTRASAAAP